MRLEEIKQTDPATMRVNRLKANAKSAKDRAKQLKTTADMNAEQLKMKQSRQKLSQLHRSTVATPIKPYC